MHQLTWCRILFLTLMSSIIFSLIGRMSDRDSAIGPDFEHARYPLMVGNGFATSCRASSASLGFSHIMIECWQATIDRLMICLLVGLRAQTPNIIYVRELAASTALLSIDRKRRDFTHCRIEFPSFPMRCSGSVVSIRRWEKFNFWGIDASISQSHCSYPVTHRAGRNWTDKTDQFNSIQSKLLCVLNSLSYEILTKILENRNNSDILILHILKELSLWALKIVALNIGYKKITFYLTWSFTFYS